MNAALSTAIDDTLRAFAIDPLVGFLPSPDPLRELPKNFSAWEELGRALPELLAQGRARKAISELPLLDARIFSWDPSRERAMLLLSFFGHAAVWEDPLPVPLIPAAVAIPWCTVAATLDRPPILSYQSYQAQNWERFDANGPIALGNIGLLQHFLGGMDESWFVLVHTEIEAKAGALPRIALLTREAIAQQERATLVVYLETIAETLKTLEQTLARMPEHCDPSIYYQRVRPFIHGWRDHPALEEGVIYEGVTAFNGRAQRFRGETGAQSAIVPMLDALLGITHAPDPLRTYLEEMRSYMPKGHRAFLSALETGVSVRDFLTRASLGKSALRRTLREVYNACVEALARFRLQHLEYAGLYIHRQSQKSRANPTEIGTGGTPFMRYLHQHAEETLTHRL